MLHDFLHRHTGFIDPGRPPASTFATESLIEATRISFAAAAELREVTSLCHHGKAATLFTGALRPLHSGPGYSSGTRYRR
jgi:hypothetical protein